MKSLMTIAYIICRFVCNHCYAWSDDSRNAFSRQDTASCRAGCDTRSVCRVWSSGDDAGSLASIQRTCNLGIGAFCFGGVERSYTGFGLSLPWKTPALRSRSGSRRVGVDCVHNPVYHCLRTMI